MSVSRARWVVLSSFLNLLAVSDYFSIRRLGSGERRPGAARSLARKPETENREKEIATFCQKSIYQKSFHHHLSIYLSIYF